MVVHLIESSKPEQREEKINIEEARVFFNKLLENLKKGILFPRSISLIIEDEDIDSLFAEIYSSARQLLDIRRGMEKLLLKSLMEKISTGKLKKGSLLKIYYNRNENRVGFKVKR